MPSHLSKVTYRGVRPPKRIVRLLARHHPRVKLCWAPHLKVWGLVQVEPAPSKLITLIGKKTSDGEIEYRHPNFDNTIRYLYSISPAQFFNKWDIDRFIEGIDAPAEKAAVEGQKKAEESIAEGSERLYQEVKTQTFVAPLQGLKNGSPAQRKASG